MRFSQVRIQSSHCEAQDFYGVLQNLDHNLLMHLALGYECRVYDFGSRGNYWEFDDGSTEQLIEHAARLARLRASRGFGRHGACRRRACGRARRGGRDARLGGGERGRRRRARVQPVV